MPSAQHPSPSHPPLSVPPQASPPTDRPFSAPAQASASAPTHPPVCTIVPPYLLEALASSDDPHVAAHAQATLEVDAELREARGIELRPSSAAPRRKKRPPRPARGTSDAPQRAIHDAERGTTLPGTLVRSEGEADTGDREVREAYDGLGATWDLWQDTYGRNSLDGRGLPLIATVHFSRDYDNAFWDGTQMVFGDGDGVVFLPFTRSLDVIGHELAHGVTQFTSGLNYQDQSGALNESVSDVFGVLVKQRLLGQSAEQADWLIGADLLGPDVKGVAGEPWPPPDGEGSASGGATASARPTATQPARTAATTSDPAPWRAVAALTVSAAKVSKSQSALMSPVMVSNQTWPAASQALPPSVVATTWKALFGMPELMWTPPLSSWVST